MSKPTEAQVRALELAHKEQYIRLVASNRLWCQLFKKIGNVSKTSPKWISLYNFGKVIAKQAGSWYVREKKLEERGKIPAVRKDILKYFLQPKEEAKLVTVANSYLGTTIKGIGIIPLIVWGIVVLVLAFTAYEITDELNTTAEEKAELLKQTETTLKDLNVTGPEAAAIISNTQAQASANETGGGLFGGIMPKLAIGALLIFLFMNKSKTTT